MADCLCKAIACIIIATVIAIEKVHRDTMAWGDFVTEGTQDCA